MAARQRCRPGRAKRQIVSPFFIADDGTISYQLVSRKNGRPAGRIDVNKPLTTGWTHWQLAIDKTLAHASNGWISSPRIQSRPSRPSCQKVFGFVFNKMERPSNNGVPAGWQVTVPTSPKETMIAYGWKTVPLPIGLELIDFEVNRNEGNDRPAGFKSTLRVTDSDGETASGACWMNHPFSYPSGWLRTWTGLNYKISQASWSPENLGQSTVQILRDRGWLLKWIGSLLIVVASS
jgi:hypothetical protein